MTETTETQEDWALRYAAERTRRIKMENRLFGLMYESMALVQIIDNSLEFILGPQNVEMEKAATLLLKLVDHTVDISVASHINLLDPPWEISEEIQDRLKRLKTLDDFPEHYKQAINNRTSAGAISIVEDWDKISERQNKNTVQQMRRKNRNRVKHKIEQTIGQHKKRNAKSG